MNKFQLIDNVKKQSKLGKDIVMMEMNFIRWMAHGMQMDEKAGVIGYTHMKPEDITKDMIDITIARLDAMPENIEIEFCKEKKVFGI